MSFASTTQIDAHEKRHQEMREQAARSAEAHKGNVQVFTKMWLALGPDVIKVAGTNHDAELAEARGLAAHRWSQLLNQEAQVLRDEQALALRPRTRPSQLGDDLLPDRTIASRDAAWADDTKARIAALADLRELVKIERKALEALKLDFKK